MMDTLIPNEEVMAREILTIAVQRPFKHNTFTRALKGSERNQPCPCGGGRKTKHCWPRCQIRK